MEFLSVQQAADKFGVTVRTVQKWAKENKLSGAKKVGREWLIPIVATGPCDSEFDKGLEDKKLTDAEIPLIILKESFTPGSCLEHIEKINDADSKNIAMAEYYYLRGEIEKSASIFERYVNHSDESMSFSASFLYSFSNISMNRPRIALLTLSDIRKYIFLKYKSGNTIKENAPCIFISSIAGVLLHSEEVEITEMVNILKYLPEGSRMFGAYVMAHFAYQKKDYNKAIGIAESAIAVSSAVYPVPFIYLKIILAVALINMKRIDEAVVAFNEALELALPDGFLKPFTEHHGLLLGLVEVCMKDKYPTEYRKITASVECFLSGWSDVHNAINDRSVTANLTPTEFVVAMLFDRDWSMKEISSYMNISLRMVKYYISTIYEKLCISRREELREYMLK